MSLIHKADEEGTELRLSIEFTLLSTQSKFVGAHLWHIAIGIIRVWRELAAVIQNLGKTGIINF